MILLAGLKLSYYFTIHFKHILRSANINYITSSNTEIAFTVIFKTFFDHCQKVLTTFKPVDCQLTLHVRI